MTMSRFDKGYNNLIAFGVVTDWAGKLLTYSYLVIHRRATTCLNAVTF